MKGPGIKEYIEFITNLKQSAHEEGKKYIDVSSRDIHLRISPNHATMPTCCQAIYKLMLEGDELIEVPKGQTGFGSRLLVRYYVDQLEERNVKFEPKKRGRPVKSEEEKKRKRLMKTNRSTDDLKELITLWLQERGWNLEITNNQIQATKDHLIWIICIQGSRRGRKQTLTSKLNQILSEIDKEASFYSIAFNEDSNYKKQWNDFPQLFKNKMNVSLLFADKNGKITEIH